MEPRSNVPATVSLVCSILLIVFYFGGMCVSMIPIIGMIVFILIPVEWILAFTALITGIVGYRTAATMDGQGYGASLVGLIISAIWMLMQFVAMLLLFFVGGTFFVLAILGAAVEG
jgi:hypothetical protein